MSDAGTRASRRGQRPRRDQRAAGGGFGSREDLEISSWLLAALATLAATAITNLAIARVAREALARESTGTVPTVVAWAGACWLAVAFFIWSAAALGRARPRLTPESARPGGRRSRASEARRRREQAQRDAEGGPGTVLWRSRVRSRWLWFYLAVGAQALAGVVNAALALLVLVRDKDTVTWYTGPTREDVEPLDQVLLAAVLLVVAVGWWGLAHLLGANNERLRDRQQRVAGQIYALARDRGWHFERDHLEGVKVLEAPPFSRVVGLGVAPGATRREGRPIAAAWLEGDFGPAVLPYRSFTSRAVWVELDLPLEQVDIVPERFADALVKLVGGRDLDVESFAFNRRWRVKATDERQAHGILQPSMIELLNEIDDPSIAFHVAGRGVVIWDDGRDEAVDLGARADLLEEFVRRLPGHLRGR